MQNIRNKTVTSVLRIFLDFLRIEVLRFNTFCNDGFDAEVHHSTRLDTLLIYTIILLNAIIHRHMYLNTFHHVCHAEKIFLFQLSYSHLDRVRLFDNSTI